MGRKWTGRLALVVWHACAAGAVFVLTADLSIRTRRAAVAAVVVEVVASTRAPRLTARAHGRFLHARSLVTNRGRCGADISAGAAVVRIVTQIGAGPVAAVDSPLDALVNARSRHARTVLKGTRIVTRSAATPAIVEIVGEVGTVIPATCLSVDAAIISAGPAVRIGAQIAACSIANRGGTTGVIAT